MRVILFILCLALTPIAAVAQNETPESAAIEDVIQGQLDAFSAGNVMTAWTFASPTIQDMFGTPAYFGTMVERGYPMVWQPGETTFLGLRQDGGRLIQQVQIVDRAGRLHLLDYDMVQIDGNWRIAGVMVLRGQGVGA